VLPVVPAAVVLEAVLLPVAAAVVPLAPARAPETSIKATVLPEAVEVTKLPARGPLADVPVAEVLLVGAADVALLVAAEPEVLLRLLLLPVEVLLRLALVPVAVLPAFAPWKAPDQFALPSID
jgi:hypothetical protein